MEEYKTNQHYNYSIGLPVEYYDINISNEKQDNDIMLIKIGRLFKGIMGAEDPYKAAVDFSEYVIENGGNLLPSIIVFYVDKFKSLPAIIQSHVIQNTSEENNYFREDSGSDKIAFFANTEEYRTSSSSVGSMEQSPATGISEQIKNKISPIALSETIALSQQSEIMTKKSQASKLSDSTYNTISQSTHNNYRTVTPMINHLEAAQLAKTDIEADSYGKFNDCYRVKREYIFKMNPYNIEHRQDNTSEFILDKNDDIIGNNKIAIYTTAGNIPLNNTQRVRDFYSVMPPNREESNKLSKTKEEEKSPIAGGCGTDTNKLNDTGGKDSAKTYNKEELKS